ncbi:MAG: hypothetical protein ACOCQD_00290 [archaeon]
MVRLIKPRNCNKTYTNPALDVPRVIWRKFCFYYPNKECRSDVISKLIDRQLEEHIVAPNEGHSDSIAEELGISEDEIEEKREFKGDYPINFLL